jgi:anti-sigma factor RsiW
MEITRKVIEDLLPLYIAGEASEDTVTLIDTYLLNDPELAEKVQHAKEIHFSEIPAPLRKDEQMEAYREAQRVIQRRIMILGAVLALVILTLLGLTFLVYFMFIPV